MIDVLYYFLYLMALPFLIMGGLLVGALFLGLAFAPFALFVYTLGMFKGTND